MRQVTDLKKNEIAQVKFEGAPVWIGRTGYTGEDGFEIVAPNEQLEPIWRRLTTLGQPHGLKPAGLTPSVTRLRTEVCYPLYGHELDENTTRSRAA